MRVLVLVLAVLVTWVTSAHAADGMESLKARGDAAMDAGRYEDGLLAYRRAYRKAPSPVLLYNMGRAEERLGRYGEAFEHLTSFAMSANAELRAKVPRLEALIADVRAQLPPLEGEGTKVATTAAQ